jgi:hypothetical protein
MSRFIWLLDPDDIHPVFDALSAGPDAWRTAREDAECLHIARPNRRGPRTHLLRAG